MQGRFGSSRYGALPSDAGCTDTWFKDMTSLAHRCLDICQEVAEAAEVPSAEAPCDSSLVTSSSDVPGSKHQRCGTDEAKSSTRTKGSVRGWAPFTD
ncbi:hypothetical protein NDU88_005919 [Pleurodeles waltl]|uniref:Uncharacterized protein n=1 Tax=Pleurodeles waltl TaxID=8319 RepID=A0AAV7L4G4_PLEWA|nr:hypothetical protein NDU88_005919 [Pleurodeles waltl]